MPNDPSDEEIVEEMLDMASQPSVIHVPEDPLFEQLDGDAQSKASVSGEEVHPDTTHDVAIVTADSVPDMTGSSFLTDELRESLGLPQRAVEEDIVREDSHPKEESQVDTAVNDDEDTTLRQALTSPSIAAVEPSNMKANNEDLSIDKIEASSIPDDAAEQRLERTEQLLQSSLETITTLTQRVSQLEDILQLRKEQEEAESYRVGRDDRVATDDSWMDVTSYPYLVIAAAGFVAGAIQVARYYTFMVE